MIEKNENSEKRLARQAAEEEARRVADSKERERQRQRALNLQAKAEDPAFDFFDQWEDRDFD